MILIKALGFASGAPCPFAGQYLKSFDFNANGGLGYGEFTSEIIEAKKFADGGVAMEFWRTQSSVCPYRADGRPNRPLTSTTVELERIYET